MKSSVSFWVVLLTLALAASIFMSCRDDVTVPYPPSINGRYIGYYSLKKIELSSLDTLVDTSQLVYCTFNDGDFAMVKDGSIEEADRVFCDVEAEYVLGNGVEMKVTDSNFTRGVCTQEWCPDGYFGLDQTTDTMRLLFDESDGTYRWVKLLRLVSTTY